jgi:hypothetical protein
MHTPIGQCTSDCRRIGCPDTESELVNHEIGYFAESSQHAGLREWTEAVLGIVTIVAAVFVLLQLASIVGNK